MLRDSHPYVADQHDNNQQQDGPEDGGRDEGDRGDKGFAHVGDHYSILTRCCEERKGMIGNLFFDLAIYGEGCGRDSNVEFAVELRRAKASAFELEYFLLLARDLTHLTHESHERLSGETVEVRKMVSGLLRKL